MNLCKKSILLNMGILLGLSFGLISSTNHYILTINFFDNSGQYLTGIPGKESEVYAGFQKYIYISSALYTFCKIFFIALILYTGLYLADNQVRFTTIINITILAEFIFLIPAFMKIIWFKTEYPLGTLADWHKMYILSALSLFDNVAADWYYPLQTLNVFEISYWFALAYGISRVTSLNFDRSLRLVVCSYVLALFVWVALVAFCTVMIFPGNA